MRARRVFVETLAAEVTLRGGEARHLWQVLRAAPGQPVVAFDGQGREAPGRVAEVGEGRVRLDLEHPESSSTEPDWHLTLAVALLKGDKLAGVVRQGTELGVARFIPVVSRRCEAKTLSASKLARWRRIAREAAKQSGRSVVPEVTETRHLDELTPCGLSLVAQPGSARTLREALGAPRAVTLLSGPEGGFSEEEVERLRVRGFQAVRLGPRILRAETAPVALAAALLLPEAR